MNLLFLATRFSHRSVAPHCMNNSPFATRFARRSTLRELLFLYDSLRSSLSAHTHSLVARRRDITSSDVAQYVVPVAPPSDEMRQYAFNLMMSPAAPKAVGPSRRAAANDLANTPTPVKIAMEGDDVLVGSPPLSTSPLGAGVDRILTEQVVSPVKWGVEVDLVDKAVVSNVEKAFAGVLAVVAMLFAAWLRS